MLFNPYAETSFYRHLDFIIARPFEDLGHIFRERLSTCRNSMDVERVRVPLQYARTIFRRLADCVMSSIEIELIRVESESFLALFPSLNFYSDVEFHSDRLAPSQFRIIRPI